MSIIKDRLRDRQNAAKNAELEAAASAEAAKLAAATAEQARREAEEAAKEDQREYRKREKELSAEVGRVEEQVAALLALKPPSDRPGHDLRTAARIWLHSTDSDGSSDVFSDEVAGSLHAAGSRATRLLATCEQDLGEHSLCVRTDDLEVRLWSAFTTRLRQLAGESS